MPKVTQNKQLTNKRPRRRSRGFFEPLDERNAVGNVQRLFAGVFQFLCRVLCADGQGANRSLAEVLRFDSESVIEAGTVIFPGNGSGELHELRLGEILPQLVEDALR
jgi:hypothetical protein